MQRRELTIRELESAQRLKAIWQAKKNTLGLTQKKAAKTLGIDQSAFSQYLSARIPLNLNFAISIASLLQVNVADFSPDLAAKLDFHHGQNDKNEKILENNYAPLLFANEKVPVIDYSQLSVDIPTTLKNVKDGKVDAIFFLPLPADIDLNKSVIQRIIAVTVENDEISGVSKGEFLLIDPDSELKPGCIVLARVAEEETPILRRYRKRLEGNFILGSDNEDYPSYNKNDVLNIMGRAIKAVNIRDL